MRGDVRRQQSRQQFWRVSPLDHPNQCDALESAVRFEQRIARLHDRERHARHLQRAGALCRAARITRALTRPTAISAITNGFSPTTINSWERRRLTKSISRATVAGDDASIQREQLANTFLRALGVPWLNRRYVAVYVNGNRRGTLMEDAQTPDSDVVKEHFPNDTGGWLYKMQPWFEFAPLPVGQLDSIQQRVLVLPHALHHHRRREESGALSL